MRDIEDLIGRLRAFGINCVVHGDMTPSGQLALESILELYEHDRQTH